MGTTQRLRGETEDAVEKIPELLLQIKSIFFIGLSIGILINYPTLVRAKSNNPINSKLKEAASKQKEPPNRGTPITNDGTGSRGDCLHKHNKPPLTRLVGSRNLNLTVSQYPTFWIYVPYTRKEVSEAVFTLQNEDSEVYRTDFELPEKPGIVSINLPSTASIAVGKQYRWYFDIKCSVSQVSDKSSIPISLTGVVKRVAKSSAFQSKLKNAKTSLGRMKIYANYGIWYETLTEIAQIKQSKPHNSALNKIWFELLSQPQVGLEKIASEPILGNIKSNSITNSPLK